MEKLKKFKSEKNLSVPQMGWNKLVCNDHLKSLNGHYYYANSFYTDSTDCAIGFTEYGINYTSLVKKNNFILNYKCLKIIILAILQKNYYYGNGV